MIAVAVAVIIGVVAVTCGIVADSNHPDTLAFLGVMVRTTAAQIFLAGAICTWALFAALWLLSAGIRRSRERGMELRALRAAAAGADFEPGQAGPGSVAAGAAPPANAESGENPHVNPYTNPNVNPHADPNAYPYANPNVNPYASPNVPPTGDMSREPKEPFDGPMAYDPWESRPGWPVSHGLPTAPIDWPFTSPEPDVLGFPDSVSGAGAGFSSSTFLGLDPLRPAAFAGSPSSFDQFTSDPIPSAAEFLSGHPASDPGEAVPPRPGGVGPALSDGTSPAAGLDGVDPRRARKPLGE